MPSIVPRRLHPAPLYPHNLISFITQIKQISCSKDRASNEHWTGAEEGQLPIISHSNRNLPRIFFHPLQYGCSLSEPALHSIYIQNQRKACGRTGPVSFSEIGQQPAHQCDYGLDHLADEQSTLSVGQTVRSNQRP